MSINSARREITFRTVVLSILITVLLAASNTYLALKAGLTVSASIPAAVMAMAILRFFRNSTIYETNIIQTTASTGEGITAAVAFVLPALIILHQWHYFHYWTSLGLTLLGGFLGVVFSVPLRKIMLNMKVLTFPEGTAVGNVLLAQQKSSAQIKPLLQGGLVGGLISFCQSGLQVLTDNVQYWAVAGQKLWGFGIGFSPALIGAGYIVGFRVCLSIFLGSILGWLFGPPILTAIYGLPVGADGVSMVMGLWHQYIRYIGVGLMLVGGLWTILTLLKTVCVGLKATIAEKRTNNAAVLPDADKDIPFSILTIIGVVCLGLLVLLFYGLLSQHHHFSNSVIYLNLPIILVCILVLGFFAATLCGYFAGLIGSSNNPLSGIMIIVVLVLSIIFSLVYGYLSNTAGLQNWLMPAMTQVIMIACVIAAAAAIANDNLQDLKTGQMIGATPWKQQIMLCVGVVVSAMVVAPVLDLLFNSYGLAGVMPHKGMDLSQMLLAPQASMIAVIVQGAFKHQLPWTMMLTGMVIGSVIIVIDEYLKRQNKPGIPVMAVGLGIYLPITTNTAIVVGGVLSYLISRQPAQETDSRRQNLTLLACGLVAGSSLMGVVLAFPILLTGNSNFLTIMPAHLSGLATLLAVLVMAWLCRWIYRYR